MTPTPPRVYLRSDFADYYDHHFNAQLGTPGEVCFRRFTTDGEPRAGMIRKLIRMGFGVPPWGILGTLKHIMPYDGRVVVYTDPSRHRGEGKVLVPLEDARQDYPATTLAMMHIGEPGRSRRWLKVGGRCWELEYASRDDWRSNVGDVTVRVVGEVPPYADDAPLSAVDFVTAEGRMYAVDYNVAPGLSGTGMEAVLPAREVAALIKAAFPSPAAAPAAGGGDA